MKSLETVLYSSKSQGKMMGESSTVETRTSNGAELRPDDRAELRPEGLTNRPHTESYLSGDFILMCFGNTVKTKENQFLLFSRKIRPCLKKFLNN